jgi:hypothetical protein
MNSLFRFFFLSIIAFGTFYHDVAIADIDVDKPVQPAAYLFKTEGSEELLQKFEQAVIDAKIGDKKFGDLCDVYKNDSKKSLYYVDYHCTYHKDLPSLFGNAYANTTTLVKPTDALVVTMITVPAISVLKCVRDGSTDCVSKYCTMDRLAHYYHRAFPACSNHLCWSQ